MKKNSEKQREEIFSRLLKINFFREFTDPNDETVKDLMEAAAYSGSESLFNSVERIVSVDAIEQIIQNDPFFPYPNPDEIRGEIKIGHVFQTGDPVYLKPESLNKNVLITGAHGTGKTNIINVIIRGLLESKIPFLIVGVAKQDYRHIIKLFPEIQVIRAAKYFKFNPLKPARGVDPVEGLSDFIDAHTHLTEVMMRSKSILVGIVAELLRMFGVL